MRARVCVEGERRRWGDCGALGKLGKLEGIAMHAFADGQGLVRETAHTHRETMHLRLGTLLEAGPPCW